MTGMEMMISTAIKSLGIDKDLLLSKIEGAFSQVQTMQNDIDQIKTTLAEIQKISFARSE